ncbi:GNAT family N-acetyltransferase [Levilactobacillus wangkuiensis]|uniref:GNAT family N-acetyltransferase n=1 Tax=Levilactobacillus wangkuiensis TaxID=2799566 RepID=UPI001942BA47|nr:GNAT family N-acetyltransferase [Levilactobacillus wangkuiensis]
MLTYERVTELTSEQLKLVLLADPNQTLVDAYLPQSAVYAASDATGLAGMLVLKRFAPRVVEVMAIAVTPAKQRHGYGRALLTFAYQWAIEHGYRTLRIATGTTSLTQLYLYQQQDFRVIAVEPDYFTQNYPQTIVENGLILRDRLVLERPIHLPKLPRK